MQSQESFNTLLRFAESIANHTSGNLHSWYPREIQAAREAVKLAGGELKEVGRWLAGGTTPMSHEAYSRHKDNKKVERVLAALQSGPIRFVSDDVYGKDGKRVCTHTELVGWIRQWLKAQGVLIRQHGRCPDMTWTLHTKV